MNYLHGGVSAPKATLETQTDNIDVSATWRLLWQDKRYIDGSIPEEEKSYVFVQPEWTQPIPDAPDTTSITALDSGQRASVGGRWVMQERLDVAVELKVGESLPEYKGRQVRWVLISPSQTPDCS